MPKIVWCGNKPWGTAFPETPLPAEAKRLDRPDDIFKACLPYGVVPLLLSYALVGVKWFVLGESTPSPALAALVPAGILLGVLLLPVHELLHALCYGKGNRVYVGVSLKKFAAFAVCHEPISKRRFVAMSLAPVILGIAPLLAFFFAPPSVLLSGLCVPAGIVGMLSPMPDYMDVRLVCAQVPKGGIVQSSNSGIYWYGGGQSNEAQNAAE